MKRIGKLDLNIKVEPVLIFRNDLGQGHPAALLMHNKDLYIIRRIDIND